MNDQNNVAMPIVVGLLSILIVLETIALGYVTMRFANAQLEQKQVAVTTDTDPEPVPLFYTDADYPGVWRYGRNLMMLDPETDQEAIVYSVQNSYLQLVAVPQVGYDGRVFISELCDGCDNPFFSLSELDISNDRQPRRIETLKEYGEILRDAVAVSPDQTRIAFIPYDAEAAEGVSMAPALYVYDLLTGETRLVGQLSEMLGTEPKVKLGHSFMVRIDDAHSMLGITGGGISWKDNSCVITQVFEGPTSRDGIEYVTFCEGE